MSADKYVLYNSSSKQYLKSLVGSNLVTTPSTSDAFVLDSKSLAAVIAKPLGVQWKVKPLKEPKYRNVPTVVDGVKFDSKAEARRYSELLILERGKAISNLQRQSRFQINVNGQKVCTYVADFCYNDKNGRLVIEDVKGGNATQTPLYKLKKKLMKATYGIEIQEVQ